MNTLPLADLTGSRAEHQKLHEWVWLHLLGDGIRALALAWRWDDAVAHAQAHRGIGLHFMEGRDRGPLRQRRPDTGTSGAGGSHPAAAMGTPGGLLLKVMCAHPDDTPRQRDVTAMIARFVEHQPIPGYAFFRAQLGLTATILTATIDPEAASRVLVQVADEVIESGDGYAARETPRHHDTLAPVTDGQHAVLTDLLAASGLGTGTMPEPLRQRLLDSTWAAAQELRASLQQPERPTMRA